MTTVDWVTALIAIWGAALSTFIFFSQRREKRRRVKVRLSLGLVGGPETQPMQVLFIEAANPGNRTVTLTSTGLLLPGGRQFAIPMPHTLTLPLELEEGKSCTTWLELEEVLSGLREEGLSGRVRLVGKFRDAIGTTYRSKPLHLDTSHWQKALKREAV